MASYPFRQSVTPRLIPVLFRLSFSMNSGCPGLPRSSKPISCFTERIFSPPPCERASIERDAYRTMFSLDDETLKNGGESILTSKGDLGQLLFWRSSPLTVRVVVLSCVWFKTSMSQA
ncbi:AAA family ATPase [Bradyrhizobium sp. sGM-13]|uniref:AAA family ATPase n=1 Tax=Bradyrhizobium sp. sGM-13 TaxID=2831781 RepID=UPI001BD1285B|nr:AAA family ATPase [Bradyrhizobium sp. sGM-13]